MRKMTVGSNYEYTLNQETMVYQNKLPKGTKFWIGYWGAPYLVITPYQMICLGTKEVSKLNKLLNTNKIAETITQL